MYGWLADLVLLIHAAFVLLVAFGGLLAVRWPVFAWVHIPMVLWGAYVEFAGRICPLTPLENRLRAAAGDAVSGAGFVERMVEPLLYPGWLDRGTQILLGSLVITGNAVIYVFVCRRVMRRRQRAKAGTTDSEE